MRFPAARSASIVTPWPQHSKFSTDLGVRAAQIVFEPWQQADRDLIVEPGPSTTALRPQAAPVAAAALEELVLDPVVGAGVRDREPEQVSGSGHLTSTKTATRSAPTTAPRHIKPAQPGHHHPEARRSHWHRRRPVPPRPATGPLLETIMNG
jgi:hypothetical protein